MHTTHGIEIFPALRRHHKGTGGAHRLYQCLNIGLGAAQNQSKRTQASMNDDSPAWLYSARTKRARQRVDRQRFGRLCNDGLLRHLVLLSMQ